MEQPWLERGSIVNQEVIGLFSSALDSGPDLGNKLLHTDTSPG